MMVNSLIDDELAEIAKEYQPGLLAWLKRRRDRWARLRGLEDGINKAALAGDEPGLKLALAAYRTFFIEMTGKLEEAQAMPLFGKRMP
jgi:hypothetical protein